MKNKRDNNYWKTLFHHKKTAEGIQKKWGVPINKYRTSAIVAVLMDKSYGR